MDTIHAMATFKKASKAESKLRVFLHGPSGAGKTYTALKIAQEIVGGDMDDVYYLDTEQGSAEKYSDIFPGFNTLNIEPPYTVDKLVQPMLEAGKLGAKVIVIDSLTHFWKGPGGILSLVDDEVKRMAARGSKADSFAAWKIGSKEFDRIINAILTSPSHVFATARSKQEYHREGGKVTKAGLEPECREGIAYEFDVEFMIDAAHNAVVGKTRIDSLSNKVFVKPGPDVAKELLKWTEGVPVDRTKVTGDAYARTVTNMLGAAQDEAAVEAVIDYVKDNVPKEEQPNFTAPILARRREIRGR